MRRERQSSCQRRLLKDARPDNAAVALLSYQILHCALLDLGCARHQSSVVNESCPQTAMGIHRRRRCQEWGFKVASYPYVGFYGVQQSQRVPVGVRSRASPAQSPSSAVSSDSVAGVCDHHILAQGLGVRHTLVARACGSCCNGLGFIWHSLDPERPRKFTIMTSPALECPASTKNKEVTASPRAL